MFRVKVLPTFFEKAVGIVDCTTKYKVTFLVYIFRGVKIVIVFKSLRF